VGKRSYPLSHYRSGQIDYGVSMYELKEEDSIQYYVNALSKMYGNRTAIYWKDSYRTVPFSYLDLYNNARCLVSLFHSMGIERGDRVCIWACNSPGWVIFLFGCLISGVVVVPIDFTSTADFASLIVRKVKAKVILSSKYKELADPVPKLYTEDLLEQLKDFQPIPMSGLPQIMGDDLAEIVFTSGTTSDPKGILITNRNLVYNIRSLRYLMPLNSNYTFLSILPLSHLFEQVLGLFYPLRFGAALFYTRTKKSSQILKILKRKKINVIVCVPFFLDSFLNNILRRARQKGVYKCLRLMSKVSARLPFKARKVLCYFVRRNLGRDIKFFVCGGSKLNKATEDFWMSMGIKLLQGYGLTEASPIVTCNVIGRHKAHTVGKSLPMQEIRIDDDGEILIRGQNVTSGYYKDEGATKAAFKEGWFKTGDIGELDEDGYLIIKGRKKEMILTSSGLNVFPQDIESALNNLPPVRESCVIGLERGDKTIIYAALIPEPSCPETIKEIIKKANQGLSPHQKIQEASFWTDKDFPKTSTMKVKKYEVARILKERRELEKKEEPPIKQEKKTGFSLITLLAHFLQISPGKISNNSRLIDDLGLDSLGLVELVVMLEIWFNIDFDESNLSPSTTVAELQNLIDTAAESAVKIPEVSWARTPLAVQVRAFLQKLCNMYLRTIFDLEIRGRELLDGVSLPVIFAANHTSHLDTFAILSSLPPKLKKKTAVAAAADYFFNINVEPNKRRGLMHKMLPVIAPLLINAFPFCRKESIRKNLEVSGDLLDEGWSIIVYPEGTRSKNGEMTHFKPGVGLMASEMLVPVVPVKLQGLYDILPKGKIKPRKGKAKVSFGKPLFFTGEHDYSLVARKIENSLRQL